MKKILSVIGNACFAMFASLIGFIWFIIYAPTANGAVIMLALTMLLIALGQSTIPNILSIEVNKHKTREEKITQSLQSAYDHWLNILSWEEPVFIGRRRLVEISIDDIQNLLSTFKTYANFTLKEDISKHTQLRDSTFGIVKQLKHMLYEIRDYPTNKQKRQINKLLKKLVKVKAPQILELITKDRIYFEKKFQRLQLIQQIILACVPVYSAACCVYLSKIPKLPSGLFTLSDFLSFVSVIALSLFLALGLLLFKKDLTQKFQFQLFS